jgi:carboxypeptidase PM20D1
LCPSLIYAQETSSQYTSEHQRRAPEIYRTVIGFRTAETHGQVPKMADYLADLFRAGGFAAGYVRVVPLTRQGGEQTASLVVRYRGTGASGKKAVLFLAHMDVVDAQREDWTRDPFTLVEENGYFFGRGTLDDKSGVTLLTSTFLRLKAEGFVPVRD